MSFEVSPCTMECASQSRVCLGSLDAIDFVGKTGLAKIGIQKDKTGQYPDKNSI
jgi:hypothetical protein